MENVLSIISGLCLTMGLFIIIFGTLEEVAPIAVAGIVLMVIGSVLGICLFAFTSPREASYTVVRKEVVDGVCYIGVEPTKKTYRFQQSAKDYVVIEVGNVISGTVGLSCIEAAKKPRYKLLGR